MTQSTERSAAGDSRLARALRRGDTLRKASVAIGCIAPFLVFSALNSTFYQVSNLVDIMLQSSINAVIAVGMTLVIMTRGIDLSVGSVVGLSSMVAADMLSHGVAACIGAGLLFATPERIVGTLRVAVADLSASERRTILRGTAERFYRI